jgi:putative peptidoglycan lipid II flippase
MRQGVRFRWTYRFGEGAGKRARGLAGAGLGSLMAQQLSIVAVVFLASNRGGVGTLPLYHYAQAVYLLPYAVLVVPLATAAFPHLAAASERRTVLQAVSASTVRLVVATSLAGAAALVAAAPAVEALFGAVDRSGGAAGLGSAVAWFAPGLVGFGLMTVLMRVLYAADHPRVAVAGAALGWLMVAVASVVLTLCLTRNGPNVAATLTALAAASAIGMTVGGLALAAGVKRALGPETLAGLGRTLLVLGIGAAVGGAAGWLVAVQFAHSGAWVALIGGLAGPLVALGAIGLATLGDASLKPAIAQLRSHGLEEAP